ncbi:hypothetical protein F5888DRAFT_1704246 [Russula emetica]|nr:hypothetical protein F5888DRAFT_1704246 [Russula emetica]
MPPRSHPVLAILGMSVRSSAPLGPLTQPRPSLGSGAFRYRNPTNLSVTTCDTLWATISFPAARSHVSSCLRSHRSRNSLMFLAPGATSFSCCPILKRYFAFAAPVLLAVHPSSPKLTFPRVLGYARQMRGQCHTLRSTLFVTLPIERKPEQVVCRTGVS